MRLADHVTALVDRFPGSLRPEEAQRFLEERYPDLRDLLTARYGEEGELIMRWVVRGLLADAYDEEERRRGQALRGDLIRETNGSRGAPRSGRWTLRRRLSLATFTGLDGFVEPLLDMTPETLRALAARLRAQARGIVETAEMAEKLAVLCEEYGAKTPRKLPPQILASVLEAGR